MADSKQYTEDGIEILFWDLGDENPFRPNFNRPPRKGKRWVQVALEYGWGERQQCFWLVLPHIYSETLIRPVHSKAFLRRFF